MAGNGFMERARELAERGRYTAAPNPLVGAVVARDGTDVVAEGWHARASGPHAEAVALEAAGEAARGADLYVTLEPCNHQGRTPPCTNAVLRSGIRRVVAGHLDPNPKMRGRSVGLLREAGVEVEVLDDPRFGRQNEQFLRYMSTGRPFVHAKLAASLDGRISTASGESEWITGEKARRRAHELRAEAGCVLIGAATARHDDPLLTPRDLPEKPPPVWRAVLDPRLTLDPESRLARTAGAASPVVAFTGERGLREGGGRAEVLRASGVEVVAVPEGEGGWLDPGFVLDELGRRGVRGVLAEGGGETVGRLVGAGLVDKLTVFYAPKALGKGGTALFGSLSVGEMDQAPCFRVEAVERFGEDFAVTLYPREEGHVHGVD